MAVTEAGRQLTEAHRLAQSRLQAETSVRLLRVWPSLDPIDLSRTWPAVEEAAAAVVATNRHRSARLSAAYLQAFVQAEAMRQLRVDPALAAVVDPQKLSTSLTVTGPVAIKKSTSRGLPVDRAARDAAVKVAGAAARHVLDGGRETLLATASREGFDRWSRISDGSPCHFCAMLVSRGPVYLTSETGGFQSHDHCACTAEIVVRGDGWTPQARGLADLWDEATRGTADPNAFRRAYEAAS